ncbi:MAG: uracil-DNA glycosylase family protein [Chloroflexota bacterium]
MATSLHLPMVTSSEQHRDEIEGLHARILACQACREAGHIEAANPLRHPWTPRQQTMIVGQAPGAQTEAKRFHFAGPGGVLLGRWLARAGYDADHWRDECYITSLTRCFPGKAPRGGRGDRRPSPAELALCRPFLDDELRLVQPRIVVAVGTMAIERFLGKGSLDALVGTMPEVDERRILPLPHPSGVSRWLNDPAHQRLVDCGLELLAQAYADLSR